jgi:predicted MPP superfamily phosphohydrolase
MSKDKNDGIVRILQLSDLHFGITNEETEKHLNELIQELNKNEDEKPTILVITGDIIYGKGNDDETRKKWDNATKYLISFRDKLGIRPENVVVCPGNHDIDRGILTEKIKEYIKTKKSDEIGCNLLKNIKKSIECSEDTDITTIEWPSNYNIIASTNDAYDIPTKLKEIYDEAFKKYIEFCEKMKITKYDFKENKESSYLYGTTRKGKIRFIVLNSVWNHRNSAIDKGNLWLGLQYLTYMEYYDNITHLKYNYEDEVVITLFHHPREYLDNREIYEYGDHTPAYQHLTKMTHIILNGHVHGYLEVPNKYEDTLTYVCGTAHESESKPDMGKIYSSCTLITIDTTDKWRAKNTVFRISTGSEWKIKNGEYHLLYTPNRQIFRDDKHRSPLLAWYENDGKIINALDNSRVLAIKDDTLNHIFNAIEEFFLKKNDPDLAKELAHACGMAAGNKFGEVINDKHEKKDERDRIEQWLEYDSSAGWGKCQFKLCCKDSLIGELVVHNSLQLSQLKQFNQKLPTEKLPTEILCDFMCGYYEGVLKQITDKDFKLECNVRNICRSKDTYRSDNNNNVCVFSIIPKGESKSEVMYDRFTRLIERIGI